MITQVCKETKSWIHPNVRQANMIYLFIYGIIIRTGITCKKMPCYMSDSACRWFIVKKAKIFEVALNIFEFLRCEKI